MIIPYKEYTLKFTVIVQVLLSMSQKSINIITTNNDEVNEETKKEVLYIKECLKEYDLKVKDVLLIKLKTVITVANNL